MCSPRKSDENFSILTFLWIKTNVAYTRLEMIAKQRSALTSIVYHRRQTDLLLCTVLLLPPLKSPSKHGRWWSSFLLYSISMVPAREQPSSPVTCGHSPLSFNEPENREGESRKRKRKKSIQATPTMPAMSHQWPQPHHQYGWSAWTGWPPMMLPSQQQWFQPPPPPPTEQPPLSSSKKSAYRCAVCGKQKAKSTDHTQLDGKWYCPSSNESLDDWTKRIYK